MSTVGQGAGYLVGAIAGSFIPGVGTIMGAQIGGMIGGYLDPPKQKGNKPQTDLSVQTATYGAPIGTGYGNYAKYGNLFWVEGNKLRLEAGRSGGKGGQKKARPDEIYGTFAIGFGEGEIVAFGRIWCNGKLVYDPTAGTLGAKMANGDVSGNLTFYTGSATQLPDPRMQADMGAAHTPAYRGLHYIVFNDWPMADYGNTLMGVQVKAEIINSASVTQYVSQVWSVEQIPDTSSFPGAASLEYGYFNPRLVDGIFMCDKASQANGYAYTYSIGASGNRLLSTAGSSFVTGAFGYIGRCAVGVVTYVGAYTGDFEVSGVPWKAKTSDENNTCHGMAVGGDGKIYALETVGGAWLFNVYDGDSLNLISSGTNSSIHVGNSVISNPVIPGTDTTFCVEPDGVHVWMASGVGGSHAFDVCQISGGNLTTLHHYTESHVGLYARFAAIVAVDGLCYGVNDHGDYFVYDRLKSMTPTAVTLASIIEKRCLLSGLLTAEDIDTSAITQTVRGYKVDGVTSIRNSLEPLQGAWPFDIVPSGYQIKFKPRGASPVATIDITDLGAVAGSEKTGDILSQSREMDTQLPVKVQVTYIDVNREYDKGTGPGAWRTNTDAVNVQAIDMPIVLNADEASGIEETLLYLYWMERTEFRFTLPPIWLALEVADVITVTEPGASYELRLTEINYLPDGRLECTARLNNPALYTWTAKGQEGQATGQVLTYPGASLVTLLDIPCIDSRYTNKPGLLAALGGYMPDWTGGSLFKSEDYGQTWVDVQDFIAPGAVMGQAKNVIGAPASNIKDVSSQLNVSIINGALASVTELAMFNGANHFAYGIPGRWEIIAAQNATTESNGTFTLTGLLRGRFGTEPHTATHAVDDYVVQLDASNLRFIGLGTSEIGLPRKWRPVTFGRSVESAAETEVTYRGVNLKPLSPVELKAGKLPDGSLKIQWTRRSRLPVEPFSGQVAPLGESVEAYDLEIYSDATYTTLKRTFYGLPTPEAIYTGAQQIDDFGVRQRWGYVKVYQLSSVVGRGFPATSIVGPSSQINLKSLIHFDEGGAGYLSFRVLALHCDGTNGSTTFIDVHGNTVTANGNAVISTAQYPALTGKTSSAHFDGSGDYLSIPDSSNWDFGTGDFGVRVRARFSSHTTNQTIVGNYQNSTTGWALQRRSDANSLRFTHGDTPLIDVTWTPSDGVWYVIEVMRIGASLLIRVDGTQVGSSVADSTNISGSANPLLIGSLYAGSYIYFFDGYLSEIEIVKGAVISASDYTPSTSPFLDSPPSIIDKAENAVTLHGTAGIVADAGAFGGYALQANQASGYVSLPAIDLSATKWTIDLFFKPDALPTSGWYSGIAQYGTAADGDGGFCIVINSAGVVKCFFDYYTSIDSAPVSVGERAHVFLMRDGNAIYIGCKGTVGGSRAVSLTSFVGDKAFRIGYAAMTNFNPQALKIDEWRVFENQANYPASGTYNAPTTSFPDP